MIRIEFANQQRHVKISLVELRRTIRGVWAREEAPDARVVVALVDDATIHEVNRRHLSHDYPTDVITFSYPASGSSIDAEIVASGECALREAAGHGNSPERELTLYIIHGLLHLIGYDDQDARSRRRMKARQEELLETFRPSGHDQRSSIRMPGKQAAGRRTP